MSTLRNKIIREHIDRYYPNARILDYNAPDTDFTFYTAEQLQTLEENWFPLSCHLDEATGTFETRFLPLTEIMGRNAWKNPDNFEGGWNTDYFIRKPKSR